MQAPIEDFEKWFHASGPVSQDPVSGKISVAGDVRLRRMAQTLPYAFHSVKGNMQLELGKLISLEGCPREVKGHFSLGVFLGSNLVGGPQIVEGVYYILHNQNLTSLEGLASQIGEKLMIRYKPDLPLLRALSAKEGVHFFGPTQVDPEEDKNLWKAQTILNSYIGQGRRALFDCQKALEDAGLEAHARW